MVSYGLGLDNNCWRDFFWTSYQFYGHLNEALSNIFYWFWKVTNNIKLPIDFILSSIFCHITSESLSSLFWYSTKMLPPTSHEFPFRRWVFVILSQTYLFRIGGYLIGVLNDAILIKWCKLSWTSFSLIKLQAEPITLMFFLKTKQIQTLRGLKKYEIIAKHPI